MDLQQAIEKRLAELRQKQVDKVYQELEEKHRIERACALVAELFSAYIKEMADIDVSEFLVSHRSGNSYTVSLNAGSGYVEFLRTVRLETDHIEFDNTEVTRWMGHRNPSGFQQDFDNFLDAYIWASELGG